MQKYNQGFGCFGPMEKCDSGKWVKAEDAEKAIAEKVDVAAEYYDLWTKSISREIQNGRKGMAGILIALLGWSIIAVALLKYAFTGHIL